MKRYIPVFLFVFLFTSCDWLWRAHQGYRYNRGDLPDYPVNLEDFNSQYDDYNSTSPILGDLFAFCFSTNRQSLGGEFDVIFRPMSIVFSRSTGELTVTNEFGPWMSRSNDFNPLSRAIENLGSPGNELGPDLIIDTSFTGFFYTLMYATDKEGDFDIYFISDHRDEKFSDPAPVGFLNSPHNDLYPALNAARDRIWFCSDRENGHFDIFLVELPDPQSTLDTMLSSPDLLPVQKDTVLSSDAQDKCPFIFGDMLVFASDRDGGYGGFDLYYSVGVDGHWGEPVNFGAAVNTAADEYRPILINEDVSEEEIMMIFSSDRQGWNGGFDLWFTGIRPGQQYFR